MGENQNNYYAPLLTLISLNLLLMYVYFIQRAAYHIIVPPKLHNRTLLPDSVETRHIAGSGRSWQVSKLEALNRLQNLSRSYVCSISLILYLRCALQRRKKAMASSISCSPSLGACYEVRYHLERNSRTAIFIRMVILGRKASPSSRYRSVTERSQMRTKCLFSVWND